MARNSNIRNIRNELWRIYTHPGYLTLNVAAAIIYYLVFTSLIRYQNYGIPFVFVAWYLEYGVIISASVLLTLSVYAVFNTKRNEAKFSASSVSVITVLLSGLFGGCGCAAPLIFEFTALGISSTELFSLNTVVASNATLIFSVILLVNIVMLLYYLNKLAKPGHSIKGKARW